MVNSLEAMGFCDNYSILSYRAKLATQNMEGNGCSRFHIKLHFQKQKTGLIWSRDNRKPIHGLKLLSRLSMMPWLNLVSIHQCKEITSRVFVQRGINGALFDMEIFSWKQIEYIKVRIILKVYMIFYPWPKIYCKTVITQL